MSVKPLCSFYVHFQSVLCLFCVELRTRRLGKCVKHSFTRMVFNMSGSFTASIGFLNSYILHTAVTLDYYYAIIHKWIDLGIETMKNNSALIESRGCGLLTPILARIFEHTRGHPGSKPYKGDNWSMNCITTPFCIYSTCFTDDHVGMLIYHNFKSQTWLCFYD